MTLVARKRIGNTEPMGGRNGMGKEQLRNANPLIGSGTFDFFIGSFREMRFSI